MSKSKVARKSNLKPFIKVVNHKHIMPTRYEIHLSRRWQVFSRIFVAPPFSLMSQVQHGHGCGIQGENQHY